MNITPEYFSKGDAAEILRPTENCFYCGLKLSRFPLVFWRGNDELGQEIWMHSHCAKTLANYLLEDSK